MPGLIIKQGKQDTSDDGKFAVIIKKGVFAKISKLSMHDSWDDTLVVEMDILDEDLKGRKVFDNVSFTGEYSWKYRALRRAVGVPYSEDEGVSIDIEKLLLNKKVKLNLSERKADDGNEYQKIAYVAKPTAHEEVTVAPKKSATKIAEDIEEETGIEVTEADVESATIDTEADW